MRNRLLGPGRCLGMEAGARATLFLAPRSQVVHHTKTVSCQAGMVWLTSLPVLPKEMCVKVQVCVNAFLSPTVLYE